MNKPLFHLRTLLLLIDLRQRTNHLNWSNIRIFVNDCYKTLVTLPKKQLRVIKQFIVGI